MGRTVNRVAIDFADGSRAIVEKSRFGDFEQNGNVMLDNNILGTVRYLIESMEKRNFDDIA